MASHGPVARTVLFWSETCPHCHEVINKTLPPLQAQYGAQLEIKLLEVSQDNNMDLFLAAVKAFGITSDRAGVPFMVIGNQPLSGSVQIPRDLPGLIKTHLNAGGVDWPTAGGIAAAVAPATDVTMCAPATPCASPVSATANGPTKTGFSSGFALAIMIMIGMVGALVYAASVALRLLGQPDGIRAEAPLSLAVPVLALIGLGVAVYLAYVETQGVEAVCGPVGDCNAVQGSPYARLYGIIPIGVLGAAGYAAILAAWLWSCLHTLPWAHHMPVAVFNMTLFGTLFSLYLTFLEPFVIKAVCAWCLTSAVIMALLLVVVTQSLRPRPEDAPADKAQSVSVNDATQQRFRFCVWRMLWYTVSHTAMMGGIVCGTDQWCCWCVVRPA